MYNPCAPRKHRVNYHRVAIEGKQKDDIPVIVGLFVEEILGEYDIYVVMYLAHDTSIYEYECFINQKISESTSFYGMRSSIEYRQSLLRLRGALLDKLERKDA